MALWSTLKKKPLFLAHGAHGSTRRHYVNGDSTNGDKPIEQPSTLAMANGNSNGDSNNFRPISVNAVLT